MAGEGHGLGGEEGEETVIGLEKINQELKNFACGVERWLSN